MYNPPALPYNPPALSDVRNNRRGASNANYRANPQWRNPQIQQHQLAYNQQPVEQFRDNDNNRNFGRNCLHPGVGHPRANDHVRNYDPNRSFGGQSLRGRRPVDFNQTLPITPEWVKQHNNDVANRSFGGDAYAQRGNRANRGGRGGGRGNGGGYGRGNGRDGFYRGDGYSYDDESGQNRFNHNQSVHRYNFNNTFDATALRILEESHRSFANQSYNGNVPDRWTSGHDYRGLGTGRGGYRGNVGLSCNQSNRGQYASRPVWNHYNEDNGNSSNWNNSLIEESSRRGRHYNSQRGNRGGSGNGRGGFAGSVGTYRGQQLPAPSESEVATQQTDDSIANDFDGNVAICEATGSSDAANCSISQGVYSLSSMEASEQDVSESLPSVSDVVSQNNSSRRQKQKRPPSAGRRVPVDDLFANTQGRATFVTKESITDRNTYVNSLNASFHAGVHDESTILTIPDSTSIDDAPSNSSILDKLFPPKIVDSDEQGTSQVIAPKNKNLTNVVPKSISSDVAKLNSTFHGDIDEKEHDDVMSQLNKTIGSVPQGILRSRAEERTPTRRRSRSVRFGSSNQFVEPSPVSSLRCDFDVDSPSQEIRIPIRRSQSLEKILPSDLPFLRPKSRFAFSKEDVIEDDFKSTAPLNRTVVNVPGDHEFVGSYTVREGFTRLMPIVQVSDGMVTFLHPDTNQPMPMSRDFSVDLHPTVDYVRGTLPAGNYTLLKSINHGSSDGSLSRNIFGRSSHRKLSSPMVSNKATLMSVPKISSEVEGNGGSDNDSSPVPVTLPTLDGFHRRVSIDSEASENVSPSSDAVSTCENDPTESFHDEIASLSNALANYSITSPNGLMSASMIWPQKKKSGNKNIASKTNAPSDFGILKNTMTLPPLSKGKLGFGPPLRNPLKDLPESELWTVEREERMNSRPANLRGFVENTRSPKRVTSKIPEIGETPVTRGFGVSARRVSLRGPGFNDEDVHRMKFLTPSTSTAIECCSSDSSHRETPSPDQ
ncbi:Protein CBG27776 [Caenorhabditis briggsae]|uniref:Uncharacterized protein n=3 Tax=Caenorhabditis briggsae TaxID=6238 RepID=A0AAE8ZS54_CAEBR|nr:Protein CBG27776 [Caenorhabditis briggsae]ULT82985.1 hypothetical protein L3Y34_012309 [Caenorhabditis briggsae]CAR99543.1 Protein CBG27776 [Caenorhabditis briggsae]